MTTLILDISTCNHIDIFKLDELGEHEILSLPSIYKNLDPAHTESNSKTISDFLDEHLKKDKSYRCIVYLVKNGSDLHIYTSVENKIKLLYSDALNIVLAEKMSPEEETSDLYKSGIFYYRENNGMSNLLKNIFYTGTVLSEEVVDQVIKMAKKPNPITVEFALKDLKYRKKSINNSIYNMWGMLGN
jgi:hypothetical protein